MNLCQAHTAFPRGDNKTSGGGGTLGSALQAAPAPLPPDVADEVMDQMADSIVELTGKLEESQARVAVLEEEQKILGGKARAGEALGLALAKTIGELKAERVELKATIESLRDALCADKCADKAAADGGWGNI